MKFINKVQLGYVLQLNPEEARALMCRAWTREKNIKNEARHNAKGRVTDPYPEAMEISMIAKNTEHSQLQFAVDDIYFNYLKRPASRKYILCDYPEKEIAKILEGKKKSITMPKGLKDILPDDTQQTIREEWMKRYPNFNVS